MNAIDFGWNERWERLFGPHREQGLEAARLIALRRCWCAGMELPLSLSGRLRHEARSRADLPVVGDWLAVSRAGEDGPAVAQAILPRSGLISRAAAGRETAQQVLAANVDTLFLVNGLDRDFKPRRIERFLALAYESGTSPVIVLNKSDICADPDRAVLQAEAVALGAAVVLLSALDPAAPARLLAFLGTGRTGVLLGSSGVGKSTIVNALLGAQRQRVNSVRAGDSRGRHTTSARRLFPLPDGSLLIDTPGLREVGLWSGEAAVAATFDDIAALAPHCRYRNCTHTREPGCAVQAALNRGELEIGRYESYLRQLREVRFLALKQDGALRLEERRRWREIMKSMKAFYRR